MINQRVTIKWAETLTIDLRPTTYNFQALDPLIL